MKCPYCGGEVSSQSISCPFCGRENPEGIAFQEEVRRKIERNKLLKPFLIKQKTPELVQKMLSRILIILVVLNAVLFFSTFFIFLWAERDRTREPQPGGHAEQFLAQFDTTGNWGYNNFCDRMYRIMDAVDAGEEIADYEVEWLVEYAYDAVAENADSEQENAGECILTVQAFFRGYLGFTDEEMAFLSPNEDGKYEYTVDADSKADTVQLIWEKLEVAGR
ncbi:MAG: hypothetical protein ACI4EQ_04425 [Lachnospiraceae bacterium]